MRVDKSSLKYLWVILAITASYIIVYLFLNKIPAARQQLNLPIYVLIETVLSFSAALYIFKQQFINHKVLRFFLYLFAGWLLGDILLLAHTFIKNPPQIKYILKEGWRYHIYSSITLT